MATFTTAQQGIWNDWQTWGRYPYIPGIADDVVLAHNITSLNTLGVGGDFYCKNITKPSSGSIKINLAANESLEITGDVGATGFNVPFSNSDLSSLLKFSSISTQIIKITHSGQAIPRTICTGSDKVFKSTGYFTSLKCTSLNVAFPSQGSPMFSIDKYNSGDFDNCTFSRSDTSYLQFYLSILNTTTSPVNINNLIVSNCFMSCTVTPIATNSKDGGSNTNITFVNNSSKFFSLF